MRSLKRFFLCALILCAAWCGRGNDDVLLWMVFDPLVNEVSGLVEPVKASELLSRPDGLPVNYARMLATDGSDTVILNLYSLKDPYATVMYGVGKFADVTEGIAGPIWADVADYKDPAWSFMIELGNLDDSGDEDVWTPMAYSERATYEELARFIQRGETSDPPFTPWTGGSYTVPEPTSGLLMLFGGALLALRRQRQAS